MHEGGECLPQPPTVRRGDPQRVEGEVEGHRGNVTQHCHWNTEVPAGIHFRGQGHTVCDLEIIPFEKVRQNNPMLDTEGGVVREK